MDDDDADPERKATGLKRFQGSGGLGTLRK